MKNKYQQILSVMFFCVLQIVFTVNIRAQVPVRWTHTALTEGKTGLSAAVIGDKIMFFSGSRLMGGSTRQLVAAAELFNVSTGQSDILPIDPSAARTIASAASVGSKLIFAGGDNGYDTDRFDIYDTLTSSWSNGVISIRRTFMAASSMNGKAFFAGGNSGAVNRAVSNVDIYDFVTDTWSVINLPAYITGLGENTAYRSNMGGAGYKNKLYFSGGLEGAYNDDACKYVSVYDVLNDVWLPSLSLSNRKYNICTGAYDGKIYFAGGAALYYNLNTSTYVTYPSDTMNVYNILTSTIDAIKIPRLLFTYPNSTPNKRPWVKSVQSGCKLFLIPQPAPFAGVNGMADTIAVYDMARNIWSFEPLPNPRSDVTPVACMNKVYFAGGQNAIDNYGFKDDIDIYNLYPVLKTAVNNSFTNTYNFGAIENNTEQQITLQVSNEGDYDLLFDPTATYSLTGDLAVFSIDVSALPAVSDTLAPATVLSVPISFNPVTTGNYTAILTIHSNDPAVPVYSFQVSGTSADHVSTAIPNAVSASYIKLYPNPSKGIVTIENSGTQVFTQAEIVSVQGMLLKAVQLTGAVSTLDVSDLTQGIYFIRLSDDQSSTVVKLVKE